MPKILRADSSGAVADPTGVRNKPYSREAAKIPLKTRRLTVARSDPRLAAGLWA